MKYIEQVDFIKNYFKENEKNEDDFKIGIELEHFIVDKNTLETISYYGQAGVESTLRDLVEKGYSPYREGEYILGANKGSKYISLEPGSQFEFSVSPKYNLLEIEDEYIEFLEDLMPILASKGQCLLNVGYHPKTKIDDIKLLPKKRYDYMFEYFKDRGSHAHNMMKGTCSLQVSIDYKSEEDFVKKLKVGNYISPVLYSIFENAPYFEGEISNIHNIRAYIWENCDKDRSGTIEAIFDKDFSYEKYGEYILNAPPIFIKKDNREVFTGHKKNKDILMDYKNIETEELEHLMTMMFPDIRAKKYLEFRMIDSLPYPLNFAAIALIKGIFYHDKNLEILYKEILEVEKHDIDIAKNQMYKLGFYGELKGKKLIDIGRHIVDLAESGLEEGEGRYLKYIKAMLDEGINPYEKTKASISDRDLYGLNWCKIESMEDIYEFKRNK